MDDLGAPTRHRWQEILLLVVVTAEAVLQVVFAASTVDVWRAVLTLALGLALLLRHRRWQWLLPVLLAVNALSLSLSVLIIVTYAYATRSHTRLLIFLMALLAVAIGMLSSFGGLLLSYHVSLPSGPAIILCAGAIYALSVLLAPRGLLVPLLPRRSHRTA